MASEIGIFKLRFSLCSPRKLGSLGTLVKVTNGPMTGDADDRERIRQESPGRKPWENGCPGNQP